MSTIENKAGRPTPSPAHRVERKKCGEHDYEVGFYPGFASRIQVNGTDVYQQNETFVLPDGHTKPLTAHAVEIKSSKGYNVVLKFEDPHHVVDHITITLRSPEQVARDGGGVFANQTGGDNDTVTIVNTATTCPPVC